MAGQVPDPRTLNSWEDAFQHPLPVVRKLEQQLRKNIDDNRQKLRSLVGASYRDLLGTAERIIEMDEQMQLVETHLGDIGRKCNARTVEKIAENHARMRKTRDARDGDKYRAMAQTKVLQSTLTVVSRIIKFGGDALQASKLLVLARLLHKSISDSAHAPLVLDELRRNLTGLRKKLLSYIERAMVKSSTDKTSTSHTLCAYALVTSSTPQEVLRRFLRVRYEQLDSMMTPATEVGVLAIIDLYGQTMLDTLDLFPRRFADALSQLAKVALLKDDQVQAIPELNLDIYGSWIPDDIQAFTPWVRHDPLPTTDVNDALGTWAKETQTCVVDTLCRCLQSQDDAYSVMETRRKVLMRYLSLSGKVRSDFHMNPIHSLRQKSFAILDGLAGAAATFDNLNLISHESDITGMTNRDLKGLDLWALATEDIDLGRGALTFRQSIVQNRHSRVQSIQRQIEKLDVWLKRTVDYLDVIDQMRTFRWDDDLDFDVDEEHSSDTFFQLLKEEPDKLQNSLRATAEQNFRQLMHEITSAAETTPHATFYLRTWREADLRRRTLASKLDVSSGPVTLSALHRNVAQSVLKEEVAKYASAVKKGSRPATTLWDGAPPLPTQASPATFKFLALLHRAMSDTGTDLWSSQCVFEMKGIIQEQLGADLDDPRFTNRESDPTFTNGHVEAENEDDSGEDSLTNGTRSPEDSKRDQLVQNLFDALYLQRILHRPGHKERVALEGVIRVLKQQLDLDDVCHERLKKSASEYWRQTYLLFGLLATGGGEVDE